jgi:hypothetical protein
METPQEAIEKLTTAVRYWCHSPPASKETRDKTPFVRPQAEQEQIEAICIQMENLGPDAREMNFEQLWEQLLDLKVAIDPDLKRIVSEAFYQFSDKP